MLPFTLRVGNARINDGGALVSRVISDGANYQAGMKRYIVTGAPGAGKTAIIRQLELDGFSVVEEAATDIHALWQAKGVAGCWF
jgi:stage III sporulation protein SpoIIIAA